MSSSPNAIAFFTRYLPNMGGVEYFTDNLAKQLSTDGFTPIIVTTDQTQSELDRDFEVIRLPSISLMSGRYPIPLPSSQKRELSRRLARSGVRHIVINGRFYPLSRLGAKLAKAHNITPLVIDHSSSYVANPKTPTGFFLAIADHLSTILLKRYQPSFFCVSQLSSAWITRFKIKSQGEIHNAIDASAFRRQAGNIELPNSFATNPETLRVAYAGRLIPEKGIMKLISSTEFIAGSVELYIAGSGPLSKEVAAIATEKEAIHYLGRIDHDQLASLLMQCDVFCFPTEYGEGLPTCLLEAGACGCALIATNTGGTAEIIPSDQFGIVLDDTRPETIAAALDELAANPQRLSVLRDNSRCHIEEHFSWKRTEEELLRALCIGNESLAKPDNRVTCIQDK